MHVVWILSSDYFCHFLQIELSHFSGIIYHKVNGQGIPFGRNSYSFIQILAKLHWCFGYGLKICMWFGYNPQIIFCYFLNKLNLAIFPAFSIANRMDRGYLVGATPPTVFLLILKLFHDSSYIQTSKTKIKWRGT